MAHSGSSCFFLFFFFCCFFSLSLSDFWFAVELLSMFHHSVEKLMFLMLFFSVLSHSKSGNPCADHCAAGTVSN